MPKKTPPLSADTDEQKGSNRPKRSRIKHTSAKGLRQGLNKLMNDILACDDPLKHAGQYATLANAMTASQKFSFDVDDFKKLKAEVEELKEQMKKQ